MSNFKINDKAENTNPDSQSFVLVEKTGQPGVYEKVKIQNLPSSGGGSGDMQASTYDPQSIADDSFDRTNHTGEQAISTVTNLQTELDAKELKSSQVSFNSDIVFSDNQHVEHNQTSAITYTLNATQPTEGEHYRTDVINADASGITLPVGIDVRGDAITASKTNILNFRYLAYKSGTAAEKTTVINEVRDLPVGAIPPSISSFNLDSTNDFTDVTFSEGVYNSGGGALTASNFAIISFTQNGDDVTAITLGTVTNTSGGALVGGETVVRVNHARTNAPSTGLATFAIQCSNFEDSDSNVVTSDSTATITLNDLSGSSFTDLAFLSVQDATASTNNLTSAASLGSAWSAQGVIDGSFKQGQLSQMQGTITGDVQALFISSTQGFDSINNFTLGIFISGADQKYYYRNNNTSNTDSLITHQTGDKIGVKIDSGSLTYYYERANVVTDIATITVTDQEWFGIFALNEVSESINNCEGINV